MRNIKPIRSDADCEAALARIADLMDAQPGTADGDELDVLTDLVEHYEEKHVPMGFPSAIAAIQFRMEQAALTPRELVPFLGSRARVSEVLAGKRPLTMPMARALYEHLGIPADLLLREQSPRWGDPLAGVEWSHFPIREMAKRRWIPRMRNQAAHARDLMQDLIQRAGGADVSGVASFRTSDHARLNAKADSYSLKAWCWKVLADANQERSPVSYRSGTVTPSFLRRIAQLSGSEDGPHRAREFLAKHGIPLVLVSHLPKTYLDGAALKLGDGTPVIGMTLRYDRVDNFWFCLLHELAHVGRHMDHGQSPAFVDDLSLRGVRSDREDPRELQADEWAEEALVPAAVWETSPVRDHPTPMSVIHLANSLSVHPAVVAGKVRHERKNFRLLSQFVGSGEVRRHLEPSAP